MAEDLELEQEQVKQDRVEQITDYVEQNQKIVGGIAVAVVLLVIAVVYVFAKYLPEQNLKAQQDIFMAEMVFKQDSFALALNGRPLSTNSPKITGVLEVAGKYKWTKTGNLANFYAGICYLNLKQFDKAIEYLDKFSTSDPVMGGIKLYDIGNAYAEKSNMDEAIKYYEKAAAYSENDGYTAYYLKTAGLAYEKQGKKAEAKKLYEKIRDQFPKSEEAASIDKYLARVNG